MISVYGLVYYTLEYAKQSVQSIVATAGEELEINVIDSRSVRSDEILEWGKQAVADGQITRFIQASTNCKGAGPVWAYKAFPPQDGNSDCDFIVITDLDVLAKPGWLQELKQGQADHLVTGFGLDKSNYVEPNFGYTEFGFGAWLEGININLYNRYLGQYDHHQDSVLLQVAENNFFKSPLKLYHMGWDAWKDYPEYWEQKLESVDWMDSEPAIFTVYGKP